MSYYDRSNHSSWPKYVSVAERKKKAAQHVTSLNKKGISLHPIVIEGQQIAKTFWGKAWCDNLENYSDFASRLPRGRTYVRNGSVIDLQITKGQVKAQVMGTSLYRVTIEIKPMIKLKWDALVKACTGKIDSLIELLQGKLSKSVMEIMTRKEEGLFPHPKEISMKCSCPDYAGMCKHIAAVLYGIGALLDEQPERLFELRHVDPVDLLTTVDQGETLIQSQPTDHLLEEGELSALFDIELDTGSKTAPAASPSPTEIKTSRRKKTSVAEPLPKRKSQKPKLNH
jgi:uncharacterized Zn finger protein